MLQLAAVVFVDCLNTDHFDICCFIFRTLLYFLVNHREEIRAAIYISTLAEFSGNPGLLQVAIVACPCTSSSSSLQNPSRSIHNSIKVIHQYVLGRKDDYPDWILIGRNFTKLFLSTTNSTLISWHAN